MNGWTGQFLRVNLTAKTFKKESFSEDFARKWIGGRGFAVKILYDELAPGIDPLGPDNKFIVALGPIAGIPAPNTGKAVVAGKSPSTGGYGDGNLGTRVAEQLRKAGYDALIVEGRAAGPTMLVHRGRQGRVPARPTRSGARGPTRRTTGSTPSTARASASSTSARRGENMVRYAVVRSLEGRAGGRTGMGAVMGSKLLKAIVVKGTQAHPPGRSGRHEEGRLGRPPEGQPDRQEDRLVHPEHQRRPGLVQRGRRPAGPQLPQDPPPRRLEGGRRAPEQRPDRDLRLSELHHALRHHHPRRRGPRVRARLRERRPPRPQPRDLRPGPARLPELPLRRLRHRHDVGRLRPQLLRRRHRPRRGDGRLRVRRRRAAQEAPGPDRPARGRDRATSWPRAPCGGRAQVRPRLRCLRHAGQGPRGRGLQLQVHPGHGPGLRGQPDRAPTTRNPGSSPSSSSRPSRESYGPEKAQKVIELQRIRGGLFEYIVACRFPWIENGWSLENYPKYFNARHAASTGPWTTSGRSPTGSTP